MIKRLKKKIMNGVRFYARHITRPASSIIFVSLPFISLYSKSLYMTVILLCTAIVLRCISHMMNVSVGVPVPLKRFTRESADGVTVSKDELEDAIMYLCDVENYLESEGLL